MKTKKLIKLITSGTLPISSKRKSCDDCDDEQNFQAMMGGNIKEKVWEGLLTQKKILLNGEVNESLIEKATMQIFQMNEYDAQMKATAVGYEPDPIKVFINTSGGNLDEAFSLISAIEASTTPVVTIGLGKIYSAGFLILISGHARFMQKYGTCMLHQGQAGIGGEFSKIMEYAKHWEKCQSIVDAYILKRTKIKRKQLDMIFNNKLDSYMDAETALQLGCIDGIWKF